MQTYFLVVLGFLTFFALLGACIVFLKWLLGTLLCAILFFASLWLAVLVRGLIK